MYIREQGEVEGGLRDARWVCRTENAHTKQKVPCYIQCLSTLMLFLGHQTAVCQCSRECCAWQEGGTCKGKAGEICLKNGTKRSAFAFTPKMHVTAAIMHWQNFPLTKEIETRRELMGWAIAISLQGCSANNALLDAASHKCQQSRHTKRLAVTAGCRNKPHINL